MEDTSKSSAPASGTDAAQTVAAKPGQKPVPGARRPVRPGAGGPRKPGEKPGAPQPSGGKSIAVAACILLVVACVGVGVYIAFFKKAPEQQALEELSPEARKLVENTKKADALYKDAQKTSSSDKLPELQAAAAKVEEARLLLQDVKDAKSTVAGYQKQIEQGLDLLEKLDKELRTINTKVTDLENAERIERMKREKAEGRGVTASAAAPTPSTASTAGEPTDEELSEERLKKMDVDDPSEAERFRAIKKKREAAKKP